MEFGALLEKVYDAAEAAEAWPCALRAIADEFQATDAAIYAAPSGAHRITSAVSGRLSADVHDEYFRDYAHRDRQILRLLKMGRDAEITGLDLLEPQEERLCPVHHSYLAAHDISAQIVWLLSGAAGEKYTFVLMRSDRKGAYDVETRRAMGALVPHVKRSLRLNRALAVHATRRKTGGDVSGDAGGLCPLRLHDAFGLTPTESELAAFLAAGGSVGDFAAQRGRSVHTARNQLKVILDKTGTRRQSQLVSLLLRAVESAKDETGLRLP